MLQMMNYSRKLTIYGLVIKTCTSRQVGRRAKLSVSAPKIVVFKKKIIWNWRVSVCILLFYFCIMVRSTGYSPWLAIKGGAPWVSGSVRVQETHRATHTNSPRKEQW
jgi:hypothetical protein